MLAHLGCIGMRDHRIFASQPDVRDPVPMLPALMDSVLMSVPSQSREACRKLEARRLGTREHSMCVAFT